jgi:hypothetical protein
MMEAYFATSAISTASLKMDQWPAGGRTVTRRGAESE